MIAAMDPIKKIIPQVIQNMSERKSGAEDKVQNLWQQSLGKDARHTKIAGLRDGVLMVHVDSPARLFHLNMKKKKILKHLQEGSDVQNIVFKIGKDL
jgi:predicted nucleic acid-binding Zn ribbon protein